MAQIHRLPDPKIDDRRLIDVTLGELLDLVVERLRHMSPPEEALLKPTEFAKLVRVDEHRVHEWIAQGMPYIATGDIRGKRIRLSTALPWLEQNDG